MAKTGTQYRQGNVMLVASDELPSTVTSLAIGVEIHALILDGLEAPSRHVARATSVLRAFSSAGADGPAEWLEVEGGVVTISHPQHGPLTLEPGIWRVVRQQEFDPSSHPKYRAD
jgi:hypothetical protein